MPPHPATSQADSYYRRLEVASAATREEIVRAYRRLAMGVHPDAHPEDPDAPRRFRELTEAYETLADPGRRATYDSSRLRHDIPVRLAGPVSEGPSRPRTTDGGAFGEAPPPTFLGTPRPRPVRDVPLRAGPVRVDRGEGGLVQASYLGTGGRTPGFVDLLFEILDSWWRR